MKKSKEIEVHPPKGVYCWHYKKNGGKQCEALRVTKNINDGYGDSYYCTFFEQGLWPTHTCGIRLPKCKECLESSGDHKVGVVYDFLKDFVERLAKGYRIEDYDKVVAGIERWREKDAYKEAVKLVEESVLEEQRDEERDLEKVEAALRSGLKERRRIKKRIKSWADALDKIK